MEYKVSVVLCVKDVENDIKEAILSIKNNCYYEIIVVDGNSKDNTVNIAKNLGITKIISDEGKGLSYARRLGVENSSGDYILFFGPDNIMDNNFIENFVKLKNEYGYDVASVQTRVQNPITFWDQGLDFRWQMLMGKPGLISVAGTPSLYSKDIFKTCNFSVDNFGPSDDTQLAKDILNQGYKIGLIPLKVYDKNNWSKEEIYNKFHWYGSGDYYFFKSNYKSWTLKRKLLSLLHPCRQTCKYAKSALKEFNFKSTVWLLLVMIVRYKGWFDTYNKNRGDKI